MRKQFAFIAIGLLLSCNSFSQNYWQEAIDTVSVSGYYNIKLSQEMAGLGLETLQILDGNGNETPYLIRSSIPVKEMKQIEMYDLVSDTQRDSINTLIVHNKDAEVSRFYLRMKPSDVTKYISIRGSYDRKQWFSVKRNTLLNSEHNPSLGEIAIVDFPQGDYTYYELTVTNNSRSPLNITGVGKIEKSKIYGQFVELQAGPFVVEEDDDNTVITFPAMKYPYYLSKLELQVEGKGHYNRNLKIEKKGYLMEAFQLSSRTEHSFYMEQVLIDKDVRIVIENRNNPPLTVNDVKLSGLNRYLCAYLDVEMLYRIVTTTKSYLRYDIEDFADEIPLNLPVVETNELQKKAIETPPEREPRFFEKPVFLWAAIALVGVILLLICVRMLKELKKSK